MKMRDDKRFASMNFRPHRKDYIVDGMACSFYSDCHLYFDDPSLSMIDRYKNIQTAIRYWRLYGPDGEDF